MAQSEKLELVLFKLELAHSEYSVARIDKVSLACIRVYIVRNNLKRSAPSDPRDLSLKDTRGGRGTSF